MSSTRFSREIVTPVLGLALIADRTHTALEKLERQKPLTERDKKALSDCEEYLLQTHQSIAKLIATRRLSDFSDELGVPYELINQTLGHPHSPIDYSGLERISQLVRNLHNQADLSSLKGFFALLFKNSMTYDQRTPMETIGVG